MSEGEQKKEKARSGPVIGDASEFPEVTISEGVVAATPTNEPEPATPQPQPQKEKGEKA